MAVHRHFPPIIRKAIEETPGVRIVNGKKHIKIYVGPVLAGAVSHGHRVDKDRASVTLAMRIRALGSNRG